jgi:hypothetical protein
LSFQLFAIQLFSLLFQVTPFGPATAQSYQRDIPFGPALAEKFKHLMAGMKAGQCVGSGKSDRVAFTGIRDTNIHVSNSLRETVNAQAFEALNHTHGYAYRFNNIPNIGMLAELVAPGVEGSVQLQKTIDHVLKTSPYLLTMNTDRPAKNILQLKITLTARGQDKVSRCTKKGELFVRLPDFKTVAPVLDEDDIFVDAGQLYPYIFALFQREISAFKQVTIVNRFEMDGYCSLRRRAERKFKSSYFTFKRKRARQQYQSARQEWPDLVLRLSPKQQKDKNIAVLKLRYALSATDKDVVDLSIDLLNGGVVKNSTQLSMLVNPKIRRGCSPARGHYTLAVPAATGDREKTGTGYSPRNNASNSPAKKTAKFLEDLFYKADVNGLGFRMKATREQYRVGMDPVAIDISANEKLYFYCISIGADRTANIVYPWRREKAWPAGNRRQFPKNFSIYSKARVLMTKPGKELFGCFASPYRIDGKLEEKWIGLHARNRKKGEKGGSLSPQKVRELMTEMSRQPDIGSSFIWLRGTEK